MADNVIRITSTGIRIENFVQKQHRDILFETGYFDHSSRKHVHYIGYPIKGERAFGMYRMNLSQLQIMLPEYRVELVPYIEAWGIQPFDLNPDITLRPIQVETINQVQNSNSDRWFINLQTGQGKTITAIKLISNIGQKAMILCYSTDILNQWKDVFEDKTNIDPKRILRIDSSDKINKILSGVISPSDYDIYFMTNALVEYYAKHNGWNRITELFITLRIGVKVFDEAHRTLKTMILIDAHTSVKNNFYLGADFSQSNSVKEKLFMRIFWDTPVINPAEEVEELKYVVVMEVQYNSHPSHRDEMGIYTHMGFSNFNYMKYQFGKPQIFLAIDSTIAGIIRNRGTDYKILILTSMKEHVDTLWKYLQEKYPDLYVGRYHGDVSESEKVETLEKAHIIVSTYSSFSVGRDVKGIQYVISLDQIDRITDNQSAGRAREIPGKKAFYFMLTDTGFKRCIESAKKRMAYLKKCKAIGFFTTNVRDE